VSNELESGIRHEARYIRPRRCEEVVHAQDFVPAGQQSFTQMGTDESGASCDKNSAVAEHLFASPLSRVDVLAPARPPNSTRYPYQESSHTQMLNRDEMIEYDRMGPLHVRTAAEIVFVWLSPKKNCQPDRLGPGPARPAFFFCFPLLFGVPSDRNGFGKAMAMPLHQHRAPGFGFSHQRKARRMLGRRNIKATTSRTFSTNRGSVESLKVSERCGCRPKARQMCCTSIPTMTPSIRSSVIVRGAPGRCSSCRPSTRFATKQRCHLRTVVGSNSKAHPNILRPGAGAGRNNNASAKPAPGRSFCRLESLSYSAVPVAQNDRW
jgi:hypothetical protein